jgi:hypothetical protein
MNAPVRLIYEHALAAASALTSPKSDIAGSDGAVESVVCDSRLFRWLDAAGDSGRRAWRHARTRAWLVRVGAEWASWSGTEQVRTVGVAMVIAGLTAVLGEAARPRPADPLAWVLPAAVAALGLFASIAAGPLARAFADKTS